MRKKHTIHYTYKTTCTITGRYYIGMHSTSILEDGYLGSGTILRRSIRKYGKEFHKKEILKYFANREDLVKEEILVVSSMLREDKLCMNLKNGGYGGICNEEHRKKLREGASRYLKNLFKTPEYLEKHKKRSSERLKKTHKEGKINYNTFSGKAHKAETLLKMSQAKKGKYLGENSSSFGTCWVTKERVNKKIKKENLDDYLKEDWKKGRKMC